MKEFDCNLTRDIVDLIDREADMLNRGRSEESLEGLRKRLANLFLQFVHTPEFNPEAARFQQVRAGADGRARARRRARSARAAFDARCAAWPCACAAPQRCRSS